MKTINVVAAIIHDSQGKIFATQRGYGEWKDWWEFPGGKIEPGEEPEEALKREIREELASEITIERRLDIIKWDYPDSRMTMYCYLCRLKSGKPTLKEHMDGKWLAKKDRFSVDWVPADRCLLFKLGLY
jgi:8-oxo-dGTP diphosphatase